MRSISEKDAAGSASFFCAAQAAAERTVPSARFKTKPCFVFVRPGPHGSAAVLRARQGRARKKEERCCNSSPVLLFAVAAGGETAQLRCAKTQRSRARKLYSTFAPRCVLHCALHDAFRRLTRIFFENLTNALERAIIQTIKENAMKRRSTNAPFSQRDAGRCKASKGRSEVAAERLRRTE